MSDLDRVPLALSPAGVLLQRSGGDLQVGLGAAAVLLDDPQQHWYDLLSSCSGTIALDELLTFSKLTLDAVGPVVRDLLARDLLRAPEPRRRRTRRGRLVGAGSLGAAVARTLPALGFSTVYVHDPAPPDAALYPQTKARNQADALCGGLDARCFRPVPHWSKPAGVDVAITIVCSATLETDRGLTDELVRADQSHLIIRPLPSGAVVGPLVVPGRTACLRCCDLRQRDVDPEWPMLLQQLVRTPARIDQVTRGWAVGLAAVQVRGFLAGRAVDTESGTVELTDAETRQVWRSWPPHPECSCQW